MHDNADYVKARNESSGPGANYTMPEPGVTITVIRYREWWVRLLIGWADDLLGYVYEKLSDRPYDEVGDDARKYGPYRNGLGK